MTTSHQLNNDLYLLLAATATLLILYLTSIEKNDKKKIYSYLLKK
jgi:hypothetical protein